ncbi:citryl-CoA lyase [Paraburkholderia silviterrae]|uniref:citrate synthase (unknown stereospecificity) n=1 Tax=Paraburkholderia silviterrae TaxID=2528715 RepID=A0A4R5MF59_9BURK|nr:citryl-CoA lyase [Paraburkholderia silviterrae]TDG25564.1 citryl-CoA lyase [Paraburkholderia silviterrae]
MSTTNDASGKPPSPSSPSTPAAHNADLAALCADYWRTSIIDIHPGSIAVRGYPIQELIGRVSFAQMIWLMLRGELPGEGEASLLEAALVASVDHGPQAPSIAISRMATSCGLPLNGAMASALNALDDVHGGAGQQAVELYEAIAGRIDAGSALEEAVEAGVDAFIATRGKYLPGFGHRFHPVDPRAGRLLELVDARVAAGIIGGRYAQIARAIGALLKKRKDKPVPMNIDGVTAVIYAELGFAPELARGVFCLSRAVGILAHAWEQSGRGERNKGPMPRQIPYAYTGPGERHLEPGGT